MNEEQKKQVLNLARRVLTGKNADIRNSGEMYIYLTAAEKEEFESLGFGRAVKLDIVHGRFVDADENTIVRGIIPGAVYCG